MSVAQTWLALWKSGCKAKQKIKTKKKTIKLAHSDIYYKKDFFINLFFFKLIYTFKKDAHTNHNNNIYFCVKI